MRQPLEPITKRLRKLPRNRHPDAVLAARGGPRKLEREERISAGRVIDPKEHRSTERHGELRADDSSDRAERERPDRET